MWHSSGPRVQVQNTLPESRAQASRTPSKATDLAASCRYGTTTQGGCGNRTTAVCLYSFLPQCSQGSTRPPSCQTVLGGSLERGDVVSFVASACPAHSLTFWCHPRHAAQHLGITARGRGHPLKQRGATEIGLHASPFQSVTQGAWRRQRNQRTSFTCPWSLTRMLAPLMSRCTMRSP